MPNIAKTRLSKLHRRTRTKVARVAAEFSVAWRSHRIIFGPGFAVNNPDVVGSVTASGDVVICDRGLVHAAK